MNFLFFSQAAWDNKNSVGNTFSNWFDGSAWKNDRFFHIFARKNIPDNHMNIVYYNLSAIDIIRGVVLGKEKAQIFTSNDIGKTAKSDAIAEANKEQKRITELHSKKIDVFYAVHEMIWRSRVWVDKQFRQFIQNTSPDIFFAFATSPYILWPLIQYLKKHTQCKIILLVADDTYGSYDNYAFYRRGYHKRELKNCIMAADKLYGISDEMSELYQQRFGKPVTTLYKGCDLSEEPKHYLNNPLKFVYAGNLFWGRDDVLAELASALETINTDSVKARLEIYTGATITPDLEKKLNRGENSRIIGSRSYDEIKQIMHNADVVLHVESFDPKQVEVTKYSLSTKIIDCLQSGTQVLGIGPSGLASIEYLKKVDGAVVVDCKEKITDNVESLLCSSEAFLQNAEKTRMYAIQSHELGIVQRKLRDEILALAQGINNL